MQSDNGWFLSHLCHYCTSISYSQVTDVDCRVVADLVILSSGSMRTSTLTYRAISAVSTFSFLICFLRHCFIMYLRLAMNQDPPVSLLRLRLPDMCQHSQLLTLFCLLSKYFLNVWYLPDDSKYGRKKIFVIFYRGRKSV